MKTNFVKKSATLAMSAAIALTMGVPAFAADRGTNQPYDSNWPAGVSHDYIENVSTDTATFLVSKSLTVNQDNKFPTVKNFEFQLTPIAGFVNTNVDTDKSGKATAPQQGGASDTGASGMTMDPMAIADIPMPVQAPSDATAGETSGTPAAHSSESVIKNNADGTATIYVGDFSNGTDNQSYYTNFSHVKSGNVNDVTSSAAASTNTDNYVQTDVTASGQTQGSVQETNSATMRKRITPVNINYTQAGYYVYKINEVNSEAYDSVPGMFYDDHTYYLIVYVTNKTDAQGNTLNGVYVHDVTAWRNEAGTDYKPNLKDIAKIMDGTDVYGTGQDATLQENNRGGNANQYAQGSANNPVAQDATDKDVEANARDTGKATVDDTTVNPNGKKITSNEGNLSKVEKGTNILPPDFWNDQFTKDIIISKNVTGNLGDRNKEFEFIVEIEGLEKNHTYTTNVKAAGIDTSGATGYSDPALRTTSNGADMYAIGQNEEFPSGPSATKTVSGKGTVTSAKDAAASDTNKLFVSDADGKATFRVNLKDDERIVFNSLPVTAKYTVTEVSSDHVASLKMSSYVTGQMKKVNEADTTNPISNDYIFATGDVVSGERHNGVVINTVDETACPTAQETVDMVDGSVEMAYTNNRELATVTGLGNMFYPAAAALIALIGMLFVARRRRDDYSGIEEL